MYEYDIVSWLTMTTYVYIGASLMVLPLKPPVHLLFSIEEILSMCALFKCEWHCYCHCGTVVYLELLDGSFCPLLPLHWNLRKGKKIKAGVIFGFNTWYVKLNTLTHMVVNQFRWMNNSSIPYFDPYGCKYKGKSLLSRNFEENCIYDDFN